MEDLEEAITCHRQALALQPHGHPNRSGSLNNLANAVSTRFQQLGGMEDLEEAITCHRQALALLPHGHPNRSDSLITSPLLCPLALSGQEKRMEDLDEAITCHHQALALRPLGHPGRPSSLHLLAGAMTIRFRHSRSNNDLLDAVKHCSEAKNILPTGHPHQSTFGSNLASILLIQCDIIPELDESLRTMTNAFEVFEQAVNHSPASVKGRFDDAVRWAREAHHRDHLSAVKAYTKSLTLLGRRLVLAPTIESQQNLLATVPKALALDAASCSINRREFRSAIELLEQGRAILWSKLRGYRHPLDELRTIDKELFDQFVTLSGQLECLAMSVESGFKLSASSEFVVQEQPFGSSFEAKMQQHRILSEKWDDVVEKIRQVDGFTDFLRAVPFATLQTAAAEGPIIIINISRYRSDAIILQYVGEPVIVPLPGTLPEILEELSSQFATACASHGKDSARLILPILRSLWENIAFPVRTQLVALGVPDKSRIWWCPTSKLCGLPLHAAGIYSPKFPKPNCIPDCYVSSYTPSLSALIKARSGLVTRTTHPNLLVIAQPDETLPKVKEEIGHIQGLFNNANILEGRDANHDTVLSGLRTHSWVHFACHGHLNDQPFHSSFQLHDNSRLELVKLIPAQLPDAELAFLSACHTAAGDVVGTPDEVVHLAAALQFCGFRSVVGTMWAMEDDDGCDVTRDFYRYMFRTPGAVPNFRDSAEALHLATKEMRKRKLGLDRWVKFVHVGA
jgi:tetratricopeptide (TPR) repeat protein